MLEIIFTVLSMAVIMSMFEERKPKQLHVAKRMTAAACTAAALTAVNMACGFALTRIFGVLALISLICAVTKCIGDMIICGLEKIKRKNYPKFSKIDN
ncbi:MAG: hypothetical protein NC394_04670 [Bacteroides sp.]|nr:hypothetical protein [Bacteroides sp.]